ncbi:MAG: glycosyltransferase [Vicinamibacteria bacterium]
MSTPELLATAAGGALLAATAPGSLELLVLSAAGLLPARRPPAGRARIVAVVPAHDEEAGVARTVTSLAASGAALPGFEVVVVADNCADATAARARAAGARVLERTDLERRGKGHALGFAFDALLPEGWDGFLVVDADSVADPGLVPAVAAWLAAGADAVQARYVVLNPDSAPRTRLMAVALMAFNVLRPRGRARLGLSCGIFGNGFAVGRATVEAVPYDAHSIVEDLEYHLRLVRAGRRVRFADEAVVRGEMPVGEAAAASQRARWEGGRLRMAGAVPGLLAGAFRRPALLEPLLDLLTPPLGLQAALLVLAVAVPWRPGRIAAAAGLAVLAFHVAAAVRVGGGGRAELRALAQAPRYVLWKVLRAGRIVRAARPGAEWVRTARDGEPKP